MRAVFSVLGLLIVVAAIGLAAKKQLGAVAPAAPQAASTAPTRTPQDQVQAMKQAAEAALQSPRAMPDDPK